MLLLSLLLDILIEYVKNVLTKSSIKKLFCQQPNANMVDGFDYLLDPLAKLFLLVYAEKVIPDQWRFVKIVPVHKKGSKQMIENYRPVANLCCTSKIFERLILNRISKLESLNNTILAGEEQHGFTKGKSTATAGLLIQSLIARALDDNQLVLA